MEQKVKGLNNSWGYHVSRQECGGGRAFGLHDGYPQGCFFEHEAIVSPIADGR
jgi:hypothetical protein